MKTLGLTICLLLSLSLGSLAAELSPELERELTALAPGASLPVIVRLQSRPDLAEITRQGRAAIRQGRPALRQFRRELVRGLRERTALDQSALTGLLQRPGARRVRQLWLINGLAMEADHETITMLSRHPRVRTIDVDRVIPLAEEPFVTTAAEPEANLEAINAPQVWAAGYTGQGVVVANLDTGVDWLHPALAATWRGGGNSWFDPYGVYSLPTDPDGHGTATMSLVAATDYAGRALSVAPGARWIAARIFPDTGPASFSVIHQSFDWLLDPDGDPDTDDAPDVVNLSWSSQEPGTCNLAFEPDLQMLKAAGIAVAIAAGNSGLVSGSTDTSPANNPSGFAVGMLKKTSPFLVDPASSRGPSSCDGTSFPELGAPGVKIAVAFKGGVAIATGTSFAAPHVAGAMALLRSALPDATVDEMEQALRLTAVDLGQPGADNAYGDGLLDVQAALQHLSGYQVTPSSHDFGAEVIGGSGAAQVFTVTNLTAYDLTLDALVTGGSAATDFTVLDDNCSGATLASGGFCDFAVGFAPLAAGVREATILVGSGAAGVPSMNLWLRGSGQTGILPRPEGLCSPAGS